MSVASRYSAKYTPVYLFEFLLPELMSPGALNGLIAIWERAVPATFSGHMTETSGICLYGA